MKVSEERINELLDLMLDNVDEDGWANMPEDISEEEESALTERLTVSSMSERINRLLEGILEIFKYITEIEGNIDDYDVLDKLKIKGSLGGVIDDIQSILIDLHSSDRVTTFFKINLVISEDGTSDDVEVAKVKMEKLIDDNFTLQLEDIKRYCNKLMTSVNQLIKQLTND